MFAEHHNWVFYLLFMHMGNLCYELKSLGVNERGCLRDLSICGCFSQVQAVLLLLGGYEIPSGIPSMGPVPLNQQVCTYIYIYIFMYKSCKSLLECSLSVGVIFFHFVAIMTSLTGYE